MTGREPERELVEQQQARMAGKRPSDREHLLLSAREQAGATVAQRLQLREVLVRERCVELLSPVAEAEVLGDGEAEEDPPPLGHVRDSTAGAGARATVTRDRRRRPRRGRPWA